MKLKLPVVLFLFTNLLLATTDDAPPVNDDFANAIPITCGNTYVSSTLEATLDEFNAPGATSPQVVDLDAPNIWYAYTGSGTPETVTLDLCASGYDTSYLVYTGTSGNLSLVAANDFNTPVCGSGFRSYGTFESDGTTTYYITITGYNSVDVGDVNLVVSCVENLPTPNTIAEAIPITPSPEGTGCDGSNYTFNLDFTNSGTTDSGLSGCTLGDLEGLDQFFTWTATSNGLQYNTPSFSGRAGMIIRNGSAPYDVIDCTRAIENGSAIFTGWNIGDNLIIQVYKTQGQTGTADAIFCLEEKTIVAPPNDTAAGAIPITPGAAGSNCTTTSNNQTIFFNTDTYTTTDSGTDTNCIGDGTGVDQFFTWTATSTGLLWGQNPANLGIAVRSTSGIEYGCVVRNMGDPIKLSGWQLGDDLIIQIFNYENYHYDSIPFCLREYNTSPNDLLTGAIPITPDALGSNCVERTLSISTDGTTDSGLDGTCNTINTGNDQFFTWTATTDALLWSGLTENPGIIVRDAGGNEITCADTIAPDDTVLSGWQVGDNLILQIYDWAFDYSDGTYPSNAEQSYRDVSFCLREHLIAAPPGMTLVPDDNFEQNLIDRGLDDVLDNLVVTANINTVTAVDVSNSNVADLTGIEDFTALQFLYAYNNQLTSIDVTQNTALEVLEINNNNISAIDLTQNVALVTFEVGSNPITTIDLTQNVALETANFQFCQLNAINVTQNPALKSLSVNSNIQIAAIDVTANPNLEVLSLTTTNISQIDLTNNPNLQRLFLGNCPVSDLDISSNLALTFLNISNTLIPSIDLSNHPVFDSLFAEDSNVLTNINVQNGNNTNFVFFFARNTPNLECVQVDDVAYSTANWTFVDAGTNFSLLCPGTNDECVDAITIPISTASCENAVTSTMETATDSNSLQCFGPDANFSDIWFSFVATETSHNIKLQNLTGTPDFLWHAVIDAQTYNCGNIATAIYCTDALENVATGLTIGNMYYVQVYSHVANPNTVFDICVSPAIPTNQVYVPDDNFEQALIDLGYDTVLDDLVLRANIDTVTTLDVINKNITDLTGIEAFVALEQLYIDNNNIATAIDLSSSPLLEEFFAEGNSIPAIDVTQNPLLEQLYMAGNALTALDVSQNPALRNLFLENNSLSVIDVTQNPQLRNLALNNNSLSALDVTQNPILDYLSAKNNTIASLDLTQNTALRFAYLSSNQLAAIDVTQNPALEALEVFSNNQIPSIDVTANPNLKELNINFTQIAAIDVSNNPALEELSFVNCPVTAIDVTANPALKTLSAIGSQVPTIDLSQNPAFERLSCSNNSVLANVNIQNGNNTNVTLFLATNTPNLSCIQVDDVAYSTANWTSVDPAVSFSTNCPTLIYIPDDNFEQSIIDLGFDTVLDNFVLASSISAITTLDLSNKNIADLTGIEGFTALENLFASNNQLTSIDLTNNTALRLLNLNGNMISTTDLSANTALQFLSFESNSLTSIDITQNTALISVSFQTNQLTALDVSQNALLESLNLVQNNQFASIDLSGNPNLILLNLNFTQVSVIDVSNNPNIETITAASCPVTTINVSNNPALKSLALIGTPIEKVDVSNNPVFESLYLSNCTSLTGINIQNGNNTNVQFFFTLNTPSLTCIQVDDVAYSTANWTNVDSGTNFSLDCGFLENDECVDAIAVPISNIFCNNTVAGTLVTSTNSNSLQCFGDSPGFSDVWFSFVATETEHDIKILNTSGTNSRVFHAVIDAQTYNCGNITNAIYCTDSLEDRATGLTVGNTYYVQVYTDVANSTETFDICIAETSTPGFTYVPDDNFEQELIDLGLDDTLDDYVVTANIVGVTNLSIRNLGIFDLTGIEDFAGLQFLNCGLNLLGEVDLSNNTNLTTLIADNAALVALNMQNGNNTNVTTFITLGNVDLTCVQVDDAAYSTANWTLIESATSFSEFCGNPIQIAARAYLQGAMLNNVDGFMRTDLKDNGYISQTSPYADGMTMSADVFNGTGQSTIVDWIWVELRDASNPAMVITGTSAALRRDGDIVDATASDSSTPVSFSREPGDYYIVIKHRNHLGIMSDGALTLSNTTLTTVDFTDRNNQLTFGSNAQTNFGMPADVVAMWCGNVNGDNVIQYSGTTPDAPAILSTVLNDVGNFLNFPTYTVAGYNVNDVNMDGNIQYAGTTPDTPFILQNILAHPGNFLNFSTYQIAEQLPENE